MDHKEKLLFDSMNPTLICFSTYKYLDYEGNFSDSLKKAHQEFIRNFSNYLENKNNE